VTDASGPPGGSNLPARRLSSSELEAVIRRAVEIQSATGAPDEGISEGEVLRIGQELGLDAVTVRRAIVDVRGRAPEEKGALARVMGPGVVRAARTVRRPPAQVGLLLEEYLLACEYMVMQRRFPDRTRYVRATGVGATFGRAAQKFGSKHKMLELQQLDVAVSAIDDGTALVELSVDVAGVRAGMAGAGVGVGGGAGVGAAIFAIATTIPDPLALVGLPILAGAVAAMRGIFGAVRGSTQDKLEAFLDRLEHNELKVPGRGGGGDGGGGITIGPPGFGIRIGPGGPRGRG
jgi:hypothetical protein